MAISAEVISRALYDKPVQPLFNTIYMISLNVGIPVIVTNTNNNLRVTARATIGSVPVGTEITDQMFSGNKSGVSIDGFQLMDDKYFTFLDVEENISQLPNEFRTDAAGMDQATLADILVTIGRSISEKLMDNYLSSLQANLTALAPAQNIETGMSGKIEWNSIVEPGAGMVGIADVLDDILGALPATMKPGGMAGSIVTGWVSSDDFQTLQKGAIESSQPNPNGGIVSNVFHYIKEERSIQEIRSLINREFIRYKNLIIVPYNGLPNDTLIVTYQQGIENARVFYDKVPADQLNNLYMVIKGAFIRNNDLTVPIAEQAQQAFFNIPYQVGNFLTINKTENDIAKYKVITTLSSGIFLRENDKIFAKLPN